VDFYYGIVDESKKYPHFFLAFGAPKNVDNVDN